MASTSASVKQAKSANIAVKIKIENDQVQSTEKGTSSPPLELNASVSTCVSDHPTLKSEKRKLDDDNAAENEEKKMKTIKAEDDNQKYQIKDDKKEEIKKDEKTESKLKTEVKEENTSPLDFSALYRVTPMRLKLLSPSNFKKIAQFPLLRKCFRLSYINGELWAPTEEGVIDIYSTEGVHLRELEPILNSPGIKYTAVYPLSKDHLLIASNKGIIKTNHQGKLIATISKEDYLDVFVTETIIGAIQNKPHGLLSRNKDRFVLIFDRDTLTVKKKFKVDDDSRYLLISNSEIIIGATGYFYDCLIKYDLEGNEKQKFGNNSGRNIPGNFRISRLCMSDFEGSLLLTDKQRCRLQVLDADGHWQIPQDDIQSPLDVIYIPDDIMLVICGAKSGLMFKVLKFKVDV